jgi:tRNA threonylcarbamoyladenosine biosynthesis protein TsaB
MSLIINIDTAIDIAHISIAKDGEIIASATNAEQKDHGGFLQPAIKKLLNEASIATTLINAVAISAGPGSYTGLRVGMASAKGLCYALNVPLIAINTLEIMAFAAISETHITSSDNAILFCPMIDARRMEVFTALYDQNLQPEILPCAMVLNENSFANGLLKNKILFFGTGATKWKNILQHENALFAETFNNALAMSKLAYGKFVLNDFANLAYFEPLYLKEFFQG